MGRPHARGVPARRPPRGPDAPLPHLVAHASPPRDRRRGLRGVAARGRRAARPRARAGRRRRLPAAQLGRGGHHLLRLHHARGDAGADRALLRAQGGRLHPPPERGPCADHRVAHRPARLPGRPGDRPRRVGRTWSTSWWWARAATGRPATCRFDDLRRAEPIDGPVARRPRRRRGHRLHVGHHGRPQGGRAHAPHPGLRGAPAVRAPGQCATGPTWWARRSATPSGCWAACSARWSAGGPST